MGDIRSSSVTAGGGGAYSLASLALYRPLGRVSECREKGHTVMTTTTSYLRALDDLQALSVNAAAFAAALKRCVARAAVSPDGECEQHRHGREEWVAPR